MTHLLIKSFNRPFYLDRCLQSIERFVSGYFKVIILDDGTPQHYLDKIKEKHPHVEIRKSAQYDEKTNAIKENIISGKEIDGFKIPTDLWRSAVQDAPEYVLVTEDDVWFTEPVDLQAYTAEMKKFNIDLLKLGNPRGRKINKDYKKITSTLFAENLSGIFTANAWLMDCLMYNKWKMFSILYRFGIVDNFTRDKYWKLNSILMGLWQKEYWLYVWKDAAGRVDEKQQLRNAATWLHKRKSNPNLIANVTQNKMKTTFQSSATNSYHKYGVDFDVNYFNHLINEAWLNGTFDPMENFPEDFSLHYFDKFLDEKINKEELHSWVAKFKAQYQQ